MTFYSFSSSFSSLVLDYEDNDEDKLVVLFNDTRQARRVQRPACPTQLLFAPVRNI